MIFKKLYFTAVIVIGVIISSCSSTKKIEALKPLPDYNSSKIIYDKKASVINIPLEIAVADIQKQTNKYLTGILYEDKNLLDDNVSYKVTKEAPILIKDLNGRLFIEVPLRIIGKVRYGVEKFGFSAYDVRDFYLNGTIRLASLTSIKDWGLNTKTTIVDVKWKESPSIIVAGKSVPITYLVNPALNLFKTDMANMVDDAIAKSMDLKPYVIKALDILAQPIEVNKQYHTWFGIEPIELYATKTVVQKNKIIGSIGVKAFLETAIGSKPSIVYNKNNIVLKNVDNINQLFKINLAAFTTYAYASEMIKNNFAGEKFESGKKSVVITEANVWGKEGKMIVEAKMQGSVNGTFYLTGIPKYNAIKKEIFLDEVDYVLDSKNKLLKAASWLAHGVVKDKIAENCKFSIQANLKEAEETFKSYLNNYQPISGVVLKGNLDKLNPQTINLTANAIVTMISAEGKMSVNIAGLD